MSYDTKVGTMKVASINLVEPVFNVQSLKIGAAYPWYEPIKLEYEPGQSLYSLLYGKQDVLNGGSGIEVNGNTIHEDVNVVDFDLYATDQWLDDQIGFRIEGLADIFKGTSYYQAMTQSYDSIVQSGEKRTGDSAYAKCPYVSNRLGDKTDKFKTSDDVEISPNIDSVPTGAGSAATLISSDGVSKALDKKLSRATLVKPSIIGPASYSSSCTSGAVYDYINSRTTGGVYLGSASDSYPDQLVYGNTVVVDSSGMIPFESVKGMSEFLSSVNALQNELGNMLQYDTVSVSGTKDIVLKNGSATTLNVSAGSVIRIRFNSIDNLNALVSIKTGSGGIMVGKGGSSSPQSGKFIVIVDVDGAVGNIGQSYEMSANKEYVFQFYSVLNGIVFVDGRGEQVSVQQERW